jgi:hypothetical protein
MTTTETTTAQAVSALFNDDGQRFWSESGTSLDEICAAAKGAAKTYPRNRQGLQQFGADTYKWSFSDGSAIVVSGACWDFPLSTEQECFCLEGGGRHQDDCPIKIRDFDLASATITEDNLDAARELLPRDQAREVVVGCKTWAVYYGSQRGQMTVWPSGRAAICLGGDSEWGDWDFQAGMLTTEAGVRYDDDGNEVEPPAEDESDPLAFLAIPDRGPWALQFYCYTGPPQAHPKIERTAGAVHWGAEVEFYFGAGRTFDQCLESSSGIFDLREGKA